MVNENGKKYKKGDVIVIANGEKRIFNAYRTKPNGEIELTFYTVEGFSRIYNNHKNAKHYLDNIGKTRTLEGAAKQLLKGARCRAKEHNALCDLTLDWVTQRLLEKCAVTKIAFKIEADGRKNRSPFAPSIDRINNKNRNYTMDNSQIVLLAVNQAKSDFEDKEIIPILKIMVENYEMKNIILDAK